MYANYHVCFMFVYDMYFLYLSLSLSFSVCVSVCLCVSSFCVVILPSFTAEMWYAVLREKHVVDGLVE